MTENEILRLKHPGDTSTSEYIRTATRHGALRLFERAKTKLMDVNNWDRLCGNDSAIFKLTDERGNLLETASPGIGDLVRIELPHSTDERPQYNWLRVEEFESGRDLLKDEDIFEFKLKQLPEPLAKENAKTNSHEPTKRLVFLLRRVASRVILIEAGGSSILQAATETFKWKNLVNIFSTLFGMPDRQWKRLIKGVLQNDVHDEILNG
jgi:hypothetical protein